MKALRLFVDWESAHPQFHLLVDRRPSDGELLWRSSPAGIYLAELEGCVRFFYWSATGGRGALGGTIRHEDGFGGTEVLSRPGAWSSNAGAVNADPHGWPPVVEVRLTPDADRYRDGYGWWSAAVTVAWLAAACRSLAPAVALRYAEGYGCTEYVPVLHLCRWTCREGGAAAEAACYRPFLTLTEDEQAEVRESLDWRKFPSPSTLWWKPMPWAPHELGRREPTHAGQQAARL